MPEPKDAKRASRPQRRGEPSRESVRDRDRHAMRLEIERRRFAGGLAPTPELYALAREQWYRLPGVVVRPSMAPVVGDQVSGEAQLPGHKKGA